MWTSSPWRWLCTGFIITSVIFIYLVFI